MQKVKLQPAEGVTLRDPISFQPLPAEGAEVEYTPYWARRVADGSAKIVEEPAPEQSQTKPVSKAAKAKE